MESILAMAALTPDGNHVDVLANSLRQFGIEIQPELIDCSDHALEPLKWEALRLAAGVMSTSEQARAVLEVAQQREGEETRDAATARTVAALAEVDFGALLEGVVAQKADELAAFAKCAALTVLGDQPVAHMVADAASPEFFRAAAVRMAPEINPLVRVARDEPERFQEALLQEMMGLLPEAFGPELVDALASQLGGAPAAGAGGGAR